MRLDSALEDFLGYLEVERGSSDNTTSSYGRDLARYVEALAARGIVYPDDVTRVDVEGYVESLSESGLAARSVDRAVSAIRSFHRFMVADQICDNLPTADLPAPKAPMHLPDVISRVQAAALLDPANFQVQARPGEDGQSRRWQLRRAGALRDEAMLEVLYGCGLRVSELCGLDRRTVFLDDEVLRVFGKGSKERIVPIMGAAARVLRQYLLEARPVLEGPRSGDAVFLSVRGTRVTRQAVFRIVEEAGERAGIPAARGTACTPIPCVTALPPICSRAAPTSAWCRSCWGTRPSRPPSSTRTSTAPIYARCTSRRTRAHASRPTCRTAPLKITHKNSIWCSKPLLTQGFLRVCVRTNMRSQDMGSPNHPDPRQRAAGSGKIPL